LDKNTPLDKQWRRLAAVIVPCLTAAVVWLSVVKQFNTDEIEAVHSAWKMLHGETIYVDFFQHHHPFFYLGLAPILRLAHERPEAMIACRLAMLPFVAGMVAATFWLARRRFDRKTAWLAVMLLMAHPIFLDKMVEVRPDVPQTFFGLLGLVLLLGQAPASPASWRRYFLIGCCFGASFLFLQKAVFFIAAALGVVLVRMIRRQANGWAAAAMLLGTAVAAAPLGVWLAVQKIPPADYFFLNWTLNARFLNHFGPIPNAVKVYNAQPIVIFFAIAACLYIVSAPKSFRLGLDDLRRPEGWEMLIVLFGLSLLVLAARVPYVQYWVPMLPFLAILGGRGMFRFLRRSEWFVPLALLLSILVPAAYVCHDLILKGVTNARDLARIRYVLAATSPTDAVYDGDARWNVFRPDIDYFWFSLRKNQGLDTYRMLRSYEYDVYRLIEMKRPKVIDADMVPNPDDPRIRDHYRKSDEYDDLYLRQ